MFVFAFLRCLVIFERTCLALGLSGEVLRVLPGTQLFATCLCLFWLRLLKRVSSGSGEADDGVRGAAGRR